MFCISTPFHAFRYKALSSDSDADDMTALTISAKLCIALLFGGFSTFSARKNGLLLDCVLLFHSDSLHHCELLVSYHFFDM